MSKSYKHNPIEKYGNKISKRQANKIVRQRLKDINYEIGNFAHYKSIVESWNIFDCRYYCSTDVKVYRK